MIQKRAAVYSPYLDTIGGGEVYTAAVTQCLMKNEFEVDLFWNSKNIIARLRNFLGIDISQASINVSGFRLFSQQGKIIEKINLTKKYDLIFYVSDGSIPFLFSKKNILHFQIPMHGVKGHSLVNRIKLMRIHQVICNSQFTKKIIDKEYHLESEVIYPPINIAVKKVKKNNIILSVGRFTQIMHDKRQDVLLQAFKELVDEGLSGWKLVFVGSSAEGKDMINSLKTFSASYPVEILTDIKHSELEEEYARAKIFWHAAGYGIDQEKNPERVEHFGIATAESMAAGCVPIVINKGGQPEIVKNGENGYLWDSLDSLKNRTLQLIRSPEVMKKLAAQAGITSRNFSKVTFNKNFTRVISE
ncbi:MAG: hypothetical protein A3A65_04460 [Candidatus Chisholmbacteria bacterium RIFCSPLOWO2_01_FULL_49_14]|uniref:Glycosyl transferase family 1 domain-containing protein n=1 Tax=Candidatus Chisholmbacteria bacterium RIFCSPLOWO2_01_FULL_49_14 TaxID=1797593 RepID=A0A1G1W456_9BACT|nr:MAG: hypothetical protein A3A65_04460 [Candidatus Chisholmbacteria bacterium RIFCSPLOWO2_01_FULL_49_14]